MKSDDIQGWVNYKRTYKKYIQLYNNCTFLHAGCFKGKGVCYACENIEEQKKDIKVICVDSWADKDLRFKNTIKISDSYSTYGDYIFETFKRNTEQYAHFLTIMRDDILVASNKLNDNSIAFILLDCCYISQEHTESVLDILYKKLIKGGTLVIPKLQKRKFNVNSWSERMRVDAKFEHGPDVIWRFTK